MPQLIEAQGIHVDASEYLDVIAPSAIRDDDRILAAVIVTWPDHPRITSCYSLRFWDDGAGKVWSYRDAGGLEAIVRASSWEQAYACFIDELADDADLDDADVDADGNLPEGCHYRSSGAPSSQWTADRHLSNIAQVDLNGENLSPAPDDRDDRRQVYYLVVLREGEE